MNNVRKHLSSTEQRLSAEESRMEQNLGAPNPHRTHAEAQDFVDRLRDDIERVQRRRDSMALDAARAALARLAAKR